MTTKRRKLSQSIDLIDIKNPLVVLQYSTDLSWGRKGFVLNLNGIPAGIVLQCAVEAKSDSTVNLKFNLRDVLNPSILVCSTNDDRLTVGLTRLGDPTHSWKFGTISRQSLEDFLQPSVSTSADVLVDTVKRQQAKILPLTETTVSSDVTLVAFYLPQYHPIVENDIWWGMGFTEWTKVAAAKPRFKQHEQPCLPGELGFYDLRVAEVLARQVALAREHGIGAFCFYYYWFGGRRLLERSLDLFLCNTHIEMPFCICWANEPWTRRWDGQEEDILMDQPHTPESDARFILDVIPVLKDPRYLRVRNKPLLLVYRAALLSVPKQTIEIWRQICRDMGVGEIELAAVESFGFKAPEEFGFDSSVEFPPHGFDAPEITVKPLKGKKPFEGKVWRYADAAAFYSALPPRPWRQYRSIMPGWDNTPRRGRKGYVFIKSSPERYAVWLNRLLADTRSRFGEGERLVFVNAWNEWGEGAVLEPDQRYGRAYLEATRAVLLGQMDWQQQLALLAEGELDAAERERLAGTVKAQIESYHRTLEFMVRQRTDEYVPSATREKTIVATDVWPESLKKDQKVNKTWGSIDQLGPPNQAAGAALRRSKPIKVHGWLLVKGFSPDKAPTMHLMLIHQGDQQIFFASLEKRLQRPDLPGALSLEDPAEANFAGFDGMVDCSGLPEGRYALRLLQQTPDGWFMATQPNVLELV